MFDLSKLGDMSKIASQATKIQENQEIFQRDLLELLKKISSQLDNVINLLKQR